MPRPLSLEKQKQTTRNSVNGRIITRVLLELEGVERRLSADTDGGLKGASGLARYLYDKTMNGVAPADMSGDILDLIYEIKSIRRTLLNASIATEEAERLLEVLRKK